MPKIKKIKSYERIFASLFNTPWMIEEDWLMSIIEIAKREGDLEAVRSKLSEPLDETRTAFVRNGVSHIPISGPIFPKANLMIELSGATSISTLAKDFQVALDDDSISSILLDIDSPGGAVTGVNEMANIIKAARSKKDITAYVGGTGASAAYWLATAATEVVLDATARVGSIGVVVAYPSKNTSRIEIVNTASPNKRIDPSTKEGMKVVTGELNAIADVFIETVAENMNVTEETVRTKFGRGGILVGKNAIEVGMAHRLGSFEELLKEKSTYGGTTMPAANNAKVVSAESLRESNPEIYEEILEKGAAAASNANDSIIKTKDEKIASLEKDLTISQETNSNLATRVGALEKNETIREENDIASTAKILVDTKLSASAIPVRLHDKVAAMNGHEKFVTDGRLDVEAFSDSVDAEIKDWETKLENPNTVQGFSVSEDREDEQSSTNSDAIVDQMLSNAGLN